jgi:hypothetical protein
MEFQPPHIKSVDVIQTKERIGIVKGPKIFYEPQQFLQGQILNYPKFAFDIIPSCGIRTILC